MPLKLAEKQAIVAQVSTIAQKAQSVLAAEYRGLTVTEMTELRVVARKSGVHLQVVKNTLARRAFENTAFVGLGEVLVGPIILAFSPTEPSAAAKVFKTFTKTNPKLVVKYIAIGSQLLTAADLDKVAALPTYQEAVSKLMAMLQAPISKLVRTLAEPQAKLVRTIAAIRDSKG
ncbi:MAG: 50S ribosomal protein L10 [Beggiatoa sp. IS2]|nr:MAG: 50S ribosomal protein L10 [Beggiatoa sp. IS2]